MRTKRRLGWAIVTGLPLVLGCGQGAQRETIEIGSILPLTGASATTDLQESLQLAVEEINRAGGVLGADLKLLSRDDNSDKVRGRAAAEELAEAGVPVILGSWSSGVSLEIAKVSSARKIVQISGSSTSPLLTGFDDDGYLFRTIGSDTVQGELLAKRARMKGFEKVAVIAIPGAYGEGLAQAFIESFTAAGGTITAHQSYVEGQSSYSALVNQVFETQPQAVLLVAYPADGARIVSNWLDSTQVGDTFWFFTDGVEDEGFVTAVGKSRFTFKHEGSGPGTPNSPRFETFRSAFQARYGRAPGAYAANFYDATYLAALAIQAAGKAEGPAIKETLAAVSSGGEPFGPGAFRAAAEAIVEGKDVNYEGASGPVDFDVHGDVVGSHDLWKVEDGAIRIVEQSISP